MGHKTVVVINESVYYILLALRKPLSCEGIIKCVHIISRGRVIISPCTLNTTLDLLIENNVVKILKVKKQCNIYVLTKKGVLLLNEEFRRICCMVRDASAILR